MEKHMEKWLKSTLEISQIQWAYWCDRDLTCPEDWKDHFSAYLQNHPALGGCGLLLTGGDSYTKQLVAMQMVDLLPETFSCVFLHGGELAEGGIAEAKAKLQQLVDHFSQEATSLCLLMEGMEDIPCRRELLHYLGQTLCKCRYEEQGNPLFLIMQDDQDMQIPALLRSHLQLCRLQMPNMQQREAYLDHHAKIIRNYVSLPVFAQTTAGVGYAQLQDMIQLVEMRLDALGGRGMSEQELRDFLESQLPAQTADPMMQDLCDSVKELVEQMKKAPAAVPVSVQTPVVMQENIPAPTPATQANTTWASIENAPPIQTATELFGKEKVEEIRKRAEAILQQQS